MNGDDVALAEVIECGRLAIRWMTGPGEQAERDLTDAEEERICMALRREDVAKAEWRQLTAHAHLPGWNRGWRGLWHHLLAVLDARAPVLIPHAVTLSAWVKADTPVRIDAFAPQEETGHGAWVRTGRRVVCSALRNKDGRLAIGPRHFDRTTMDGIHERPHPMTWRDAEEGFIDQHGVFLTREEAWDVALAAGQVVRRVGNDAPSLYSENLY